MMSSALSQRILETAVFLITFDNAPMYIILTVPRSIAVLQLRMLSSPFSGDIE